ncbi:glycoside hydrolase family 15 protein [Methyloferula stellata]|uniref:glycoside hydrolase family 15 protein n=1 Tax=Methyloferula stellata TaxID=876270 RepID=UPI00039AC717|nr:glycoside hydrolase family 15 protein [Methyloferula stellata]
MAEEHAADIKPGTLPDWMMRQYQFCAVAMPRAISATDLVKERRGFAQTIRPVRGSILASTERASYDPDPDYFFHWLRDSALVMDALRLLIEDQSSGFEAVARFDDFIQFSAALSRLDGRAVLAGPDFRQAIDASFRAYVRPDAEFEALFGERVLGEARFNPDGTLDISKWSRPQHDGPALRALTLLRFWNLGGPRDKASDTVLQSLLEGDLDFTLRHWQEPCFDIWEEASAYHYHTRIVQYAALSDGAAWAEMRGDGARGQAYRVAAQELVLHLEDHFDPGQGVYLSPLPGTPQTGGSLLAMRLDIAVILGVLHAARPNGPHSVLDPKVLATLARLEQLFIKEYRINKEQGPHGAAAMGRYAGDKYYSGGAYYFATLGAAEFYFRYAESIGRGETIPVADENRGLLANMLGLSPEALAVPSLEPRHRETLFEACMDRGDRFMDVVRAHTPASGELSEQFDQTSGAQTSAKNLTWSYAAFITAFASRKRALSRLKYA